MVILFLVGLCDRRLRLLGLMIVLRLVLLKCNRLVRLVLLLVLRRLWLIVGSGFLSLLLYIWLSWYVRDLSGEMVMFVTMISWIVWDVLRVW